MGELQSSSSVSFNAVIRELTFPQLILKFQFLVLILVVLNPLLATGLLPPQLNCTMGKEFPSVVALITSKPLSFVLPGSWRKALFGQILGRQRSLLQLSPTAPKYSISFFSHQCFWATAVWTMIILWQNNTVRSTWQCDEFVQAAFTANQMLGMGAENPTVDSVCIQVHAEFLQTISFYFQTSSKPVNTSVLRHIQPPGGRWSSASLAVRWEEHMGRFAWRGISLNSQQSKLRTASQKRFAGLCQGESKACGSVPTCAGGNPCLHGRGVCWYFCCAGIECASVNMQQILISPCPSQFLRRSS